MSWHVVWEPAALNSATGHLKEDPESVGSLLHATDRLADDARPETSWPWGTDHRRLRYGPWRVLYRIDTGTRTLHIEHVGRTGG